jgi:hypothetical protein
MRGIPNRREDTLKKIPYRNASFAGKKVAILTTFVSFVAGLPTTRSQKA